jgi:hypothetical protein
MTIEQRQHLLAYLGYYDEAIDGDWGSGSRAACTAFQQDSNITADGYGGPETDKELKYAVANDLFKREQVEDATDTNVGDKTGTFWDHIRYWTREEFRCRCGQYHAPYCNGFPVEPDQTLVELVDDLRHRFGRPGHPSSGIRCERHNADQPGAATNSKHKYGKALDFFIEGVSGVQLLAAAQADPRTSYAYIIEGQYVHVDVA